MGVFDVDTFARSPPEFIGTARESDGERLAQARRSWSTIWSRLLGDNFLDWPDTYSTTARHYHKRYKKALPLIRDLCVSPAPSPAFGPVNPVAS